MGHIFATSFLILHFFFYSSLMAKEVVQGVTVPSVQEMKDSTTPWGLNLDQVRERQTRLREAGVTHDLSFTLSWLQEAKKQTILYQDEQKRLLEIFNEERLRQQNDHHVSFMQKLKELLINATSHDLTSLQNQISLLERKIALNKKNQNRLERRVEHGFLLKKEQVNRLPPAS
jgi:hypothetical protein